MIAKTKTAHSTACVLLVELIFIFIFISHENDSQNKNAHSTQKNVALHCQYIVSINN